MATDNWETRLVTDYSELLEAKSYLFLALNRRVEELMLCLSEDIEDRCLSTNNLPHDSIVKFWLNEEPDDAP